MLEYKRVIDELLKREYEYLDKFETSAPEVQQAILDRKLLLNDTANWLTNLANKA